MGKRTTLIIIFLMYYYVNAYSRSEENETLKKKLSLSNEPDFNVRYLNKPFKINKLNLVWSKAKQVINLFKILSVIHNSEFVPSKFIEMFRTRIKIFVV